MSFDSETRAIFAEMFSDFCADVATGSVGSVVFEKLDDDNAPETLFTITEFEIDEADPRERQLPPDATHELRVRDALITESQLLYLASIKHVTPDRTIRYKVVSQSYFYPARFLRLWRFWLSPIGVVAADAETFFVIDDAGNFLVDDAGNSIVTDGA